MNQLTPTSLRKNLYSVLDRVIAHGTPQEIKRKGKKVKIILDDSVNKFQNLISHKSIIGDPNDLINVKPYIWQESHNI